MRNYQPKNSRETFLPRSLYIRVISAIKDYPRLKKEYDDILLESGSGGMGVSSSVKTSPTEIKALKRMQKYSNDIAAIEEPLLLIPEEYRALVLNKIINDKYVDSRLFYVNRRTISRWKSVYIYAVAEKLNLV